MKTPYTFLTIITAFAVLFTACKKEDAPVKPGAPRTIKFVLHTEKDFSDNNSNITFSIYIKNKYVALFDSTLATIKIKDIPQGPNQLTFIKTVNDNSDLRVGFNYTIENVGSSWHTDTVSTGNNYKVVDFSFK